MTRKKIDADAAKATIYATVGYGRPPREHQFQKGQSGNPMGRPRKAKRLKEQAIDTGFDLQLDRNQADMWRVLQESVEVRKGGKVVTVSKAEAMQRVRERIAMSGSVLATRDVMAQLIADDARCRAEVEEDHQFWRTYIRDYHHAKAEAEKLGQPLTEFWILPEDITFPRGLPVCIRGPLTEADVKKHELLQNLTRAVLASQLYVLITAGHSTPAQERVMLITATGQWEFMTSRLSTRMAADCSAYWTYLEELILYRGERAVYKELCQAWASLGLKTPPLGVIRSPSKKHTQMAKNLRTMIPELGM